MRYVHWQTNKHELICMPSSAAETETKTVETLSGPRGTNLLIICLDDDGLEINEQFNSFKC